MYLIDTRKYDDSFLLAKILEKVDITDEEKKKLFKHFEKPEVVDAEPVKHGHWIHLGGDEWCCDKCGFVISTEGSWQHPKAKEMGNDYCKHCGAKMDEVEE